MNKKLPLIGRVRIRGSFKTFVDRKIRERRRGERRLAEQRTTKHQLKARSSCLADARSYRIARRLPIPSGHDLTGEHLIPTEQLINAEGARGSKVSRSSIKALAGRKRGPAKFRRSHDAVILPENDDFEHSRCAPLRSANQRQPGVSDGPRQSFRSLAKTIFSRS
jgi:hypothetical protein